MKRRLAALLCAVFLCAGLGAAARADFGDFAGDDDYDYSYDYDDYDYDDNDYDYSYDDDDDDYSYYDDDDDDWSGVTYHSSGGGYGGGSGGSTYHSYSYSSGSSGVSDGFQMLLGAVFVLLMVALFIWIVSRIVRGNRRRRDDLHRAAERQESRENRPQLRPVGGYTEVDPAFSATALCDWAANLYVRMQNAWTAGDISELRPFFTDSFFTRMERSLEGIRQRGRTNYVERIAVMDVTPRGFHQTAGEDHILLRLRTRIVDYTVDDATGQVVSGHKDREKFMTYEWDLVRPAGMKTPPTGADGLRHVNCPNCGAPLDINTSARCPYCGSVLESPGTDWAICAIHGISQQTM